MTAFAQGDTLWSRRYGGASDDYGSGIVLMSDGGFLVAGSSNSFSSQSEFYLLRISSAGDTGWTRTFGYAGRNIFTTGLGRHGNLYSAYGNSVATGSPTEGRCVYVDSSGYYSGFRRDYSTPNDLMIYNGAVDPHGYLLVGAIATATYSVGYVVMDPSDDQAPFISQTYDNGTRSEFHAAVRLNNGRYVAGGWSQPNDTPEQDFLLVGLTSTGAQQWSQRFGGEGEDYISSLIQTSDGGLAFTCPTTSYGTNGDVVLFKTNSQGGVQWFRTFGGDGEDHGHTVLQTPDHGYLIVGHTESYGVGGDVIAVKTDSVGTQQWLRHWGGDGLDVAESAALTPDGGYVIVGTTTSFGSGDADVWVLRISPDLPVPDPSRPVISGFSLAQNYPNPFNAITRLSFDLPQTQPIELVLFNHLGQQVGVLARGVYGAGRHELSVDAQGYPSGVYVYRLVTVHGTAAKKMIVIK
jgi:hypothetical protein